MTPESLDEMLALARSARDSAYAPYSDYRVGAAVRSADGRLFAGCNVENAAYPVGTCAEAGAIAAMVAAGARSISAVVVVAEGELVGTPCGGCRQRIREFAGPDTPIVAADGREVRATFTLGELLPSSFGPEHLRP